MKEKITQLKEKIEAKEQQLAARQKSIAQNKLAVKKLKQEIETLKSELTSKEMVTVMELMKAKGISAADVQSAITTGKIATTVVTKADDTTKERADEADNS